MYIVIQPDGKTDHHPGKPTYEELCRLINAEGIELIPEFKKFEGRACDAYCDEYGRARGDVPDNIKASQIWHDNLAAQARGRTWNKYNLAGTVVIVVRGKDKH